ncbi:LppP/LprE family lipoprotein [Rhodococcus sp. H29-C3]|uniref:LppP/LprE family lipoprotein n=1 Tax=Rhodococcus sp. H29-C3 TaxID=3046307 RepID=UPI0024B9D5C0|nr:LppP/LprE family lipoprotein [Rhodococcus sp. H29-C3]MDJ0361548.1 LppP/LprE family lipoprotein [Rhodococcus sp. H29-C3]
MMKTLVHAAIAAVVVLALATGCSDDGSVGAAATSTVDAVKSQPSAPTRVSGSVGASSRAGESGAPATPDAPPPPTPVDNPTDPSATVPVHQGDPCLDTSSDLVQNVIATLGPPPGSDYYEIGEHTTAAMPNCPTLTWAVAETPSGTGSSPENIMFFHADKFARLATPSPSAFTSISGSTDDSVTVHYSWLVGNEPNCCPQGNADVTFSWDGSNVVSDVPVPTEVYNFG